ncbi:hypothetical protein B0H63DRAFT_525829 [Podospora didyma]|uniref:Transcription factor domain-containing protein n=1 Tax=Podospora didyma TaxID=330526 RepID=A0AAE0NC72_9PEZI|nr:hypothetical protein B0H63DRAFT_525829 [Podospora didyma]
MGEIMGRWSGMGLMSPRSTSPVSPRQYAWSTDPRWLSTYIIACDEGCTRHSEMVHDAVRTLRDYRTAPETFAGGGAGGSGSSWDPQTNSWTMAQEVSPGSVAGSSTTLWPVASPAQDLAPLPLPPTMQNAELLGIYVKLLSQFKASLDGKPDASNAYIKHHVPYVVQSPLLVHVAIYTAACFLTETGHIDRTVAMGHKGYAIALLNDHLRSRTTSDEGITGVVQLIMNEWYWGNTNDLRAHLRGLREMIKLRGGFRTLGLHGLISKLAITSDVAIALSFEISPYLRGGSEFEFQDGSSKIPLRLALNTPFISPLVPFASCAEALKMHTAVASILDDMRFLLAAVLNLPEEASPKELQKVHTTSAWIYERMNSLPAEGPMARRLSAAASPTPFSAASPTALGGQDSEASEEQTHPLQRQTSLGLPQQQTQQHQQASRRRSYQGPAAKATTPEMRNTPERSTPPLSSTTNNATEQPDYIYQAVRLTALMYSQAIMLRQPFSAVVSASDFAQLWTTAWHVPLSTWRSLLGVFNWLLLPLVPSGKSTPHDRFVKGALSISLLQISMDNWEIACGAMEGMLRLQRWLGGGEDHDTNSGAETRSRSGSGSSSGGGASGGEDQGGSDGATKERKENRDNKGKGRERENSGSGSQDVNPKIVGGWYDLQERGVIPKW